ncbi:MAG: hypothetical protein ACRD0Q_06625, partial [Acidimicrobiales bacterium]
MDADPKAGCSQPGAGLWRRMVALGSVCMFVAVSLAACSDSGKSKPAATPVAVAKAEPTAGQWKTWVLTSPLEVIVAPPPVPGSAKAKAELEEVKLAAEQRTSAIVEEVKRWSAPVPTAAWTKAAFDAVGAAAKDPPLSSRNYALIHVAMYDAAVASWYWKYAYNTEAPKGVRTVVPAGADPSYPSEHAAIAGAASRVIAALYPAQSALRLDEMADQAAKSRVEAGTNTPSDVAAGLDLGRGVADRALAFARTDGSDRKWDGKRPPGIGHGPAFWEPAPGTVSPPTSPVAGTWRTWVLSSGSQLRPPPPPAYGSPEFRAAAQEVVDVRKNLTPEQEQIAKFYEGAQGTPLPAGIIVNVAQEDVLNAATTDIGGARLSFPRMARAFALLTVALADAGISTWDAKYAYWNPRPENAIRDLGLDPNWKPLLPTPKFPAYPSGSAGYAGGAEAVRTYLFPKDAAKFKARAEDQ